MSNKRRGKSPNPNEIRVSEAAMMLLRSYVERGSIGKRGAIQSEAWRRLRDAANLPLPEDDEAKRAKNRKARGVARRKEHPYSRSQIEQWFSTGFRRGMGLPDDE